MNINRMATLITVVALAASPLYAQDKATSAPAASKQAMMDECAKETGKRHDHAGEKGASGMKGKCMDEKMRGKQAAKKPVHDHNKEHKAN